MTAPRDHDPFLGTTSASDFEADGGPLTWRDWLCFALVAATWAFLIWRLTR